MNERKKDRRGLLSLILGLLLLCGLLTVTVTSLKTTGECYAELKNADLSQEIEAAVYYEDHIYASIGFGISLLPEEAGNEARLSEFLSSSIRAIGIRIIACGLLYSMMVSAVLQFFLYSRFQDDRRKYFLASVIAGVAPFAAFAAAVWIAQGAYGLPVVFPDGHGWLLLAVGLASVIAGGCVIGAVLSAARRKRLTAALAVPVVFILFIIGMNLEMHLFTSPTESSFAYFYEAHGEALEEDYDGEVYYDGEKNAIILNGAEYPAETVDNPEYYSGLKRAGAFLPELACAYSGNGLLLIETAMDAVRLPLWAAIAYVLKSAAWTALAFGFIRRRQMRAAG